MWSDDDWLKKFSGKTAEEAEVEAAGGEATKNATREVTRLFFLPCLLLSVSATIRDYLPFTCKKGICPGIRELGCPLLALPRICHPHVSGF